MTQPRYTICTIVFKEDEQDWINKVIEARDKRLKHNDIYKAGLDLLLKKDKIKPTLT